VREPDSGECVLLHGCLGVHACRRFQHAISKNVSRASLGDPPGPPGPGQLPGQMTIDEALAIQEAQ